MGTVTSRSGASKIRVLIADDNPVVRRGLRLQLNHAEDLTVVGEASNGADAVTIARTEHVDVVLMDLQMPGGSGLAATRALAGPDVDAPVNVIVVTNHTAHAYVMEALESGAVGYLLKTHDARELLTAIRAAARGEALVSSRVTVPVIQELTRRRRTPGAEHDPSLSVLSPAELEVVTHLSRGRTTNEDIAAALFVSVNTVRSQLSSALRKTGLSDRTQLALWAVRRGLDRGQPAGPPER